MSMLKLTRRTRVLCINERDAILSSRNTKRLNRIRQYDAAQHFRKKRSVTNIAWVMSVAACLSLYVD